MPLKLLAIDLGERSFHIYGIDSEGVIVSRKISRPKLIETVTELAPEAIAMEACASAHYWGRLFLAAGYRILLINPRFVKPFVKGSRTTRRMPKEFTKPPRAQQCGSCRSNRPDSKIFNRFTASGTASSAPGQPLSIICGDLLASMELFCRKARGVFWCKRATPSLAPNCLISHVSSSSARSMNSAASISGSTSSVDDGRHFRSTP
jgi:hypothetical protein